MGRVLTNEISLAYAVQSAFDNFTTVAGDWKLLEPNEIANFGSTISTIPRTPISKIRGARKGTVTTEDAATEFTADLTMDSLLDFVEGFAFSIATNADMVFPPRMGNRAASEGDATATGFTIPSATAAQAAKFQFTAAGPISLVFARGYGISGNNGLFPLGADVVATDTEIVVTGTAVETAPANSQVELCGIRAEAGDLALAVSGSVGTLTSGNGASVTPIDFTTIGWTVGQLIHVGGLTGTNQFGSTAAADGTNSVGYARITSIAAATVLLDKLDVLLVASDGTDDGVGGAETVTDLLFGRFARNVPVDDALYDVKIFLFEGEYPNLYQPEGVGPIADPDGFEYTVNNHCNQLGFALALSDKATMTPTFVATATEDIVDNAARRTGASTASQPLQTVALSTSIDVARLRVTDIDETGLTTDFKNLTFTVNNNVTPERVIGLKGARFINIGNLGVALEGNVLFTSPLVTSRIRNNTTVTMDFVMRNDDGAVGVDIPSMTLGGGGKEFPVNESVQIAITGQAFIDPAFGNASFGISFLPVVPAA